MMIEVVSKPQIMFEGRARGSRKSPAYTGGYEAHVEPTRKTGIRH